MNKNEFQQIYDSYYQPLFLYALSLTKNKDDAEDLVANAFVKAFTSFQSGNLKSWIYTVLKNEFITKYKQKKRVVSMDDISSSWILETTDILDQLIQDEERKWLYQTIYELPDTERDVMLLTLQMSYQDAEISSILNLSIENVRVIRHRAKQFILKKGRDYHE